MHRINGFWRELRNNATKLDAEKPGIMMHVENICQDDRQKFREKIMCEMSNTQEKSQIADSQILRENRIPDVNQRMKVQTTKLIKNKAYQPKIQKLHFYKS